MIENSRRDGANLASVVFIDTNCVHSNSYEHLFGSRREMSEISKYATILLPETAFRELIAQRERQFKDEVSKLRKNAVYTQVLGRSEDEPDYQNELGRIRDTLQKDKSIPYKLIGISNQEVALSKIADLALSQRAPFQSNGTGFKDALIALTIEEYMGDLNDDQKAYFICGDQLLASYFDDYEKLKICKSARELLNLILAGDSPAQLQESSNTVSRLDARSRDEIEEAIDSAERCTSFAYAHSAVARLNELLPYLTESDRRRLLVASISNDQISQILYDEDILEFFLPLYEQLNAYLSESQRFAFLSGAKLVQVEATPGNPVLFTRDEIACYREFADELQAHVVAIHPEAVIATDSEEVLGKLTEVLEECSLEESVPDSRRVIDVFVRGDYRYRRRWMSVSKLRDFLSLFKRVSDSKRLVMLNNIAAKLDSEKDYAYSNFSDYDNLPF